MNDFEVKELWDQVQNLATQLDGLHEAVDVILEMVDMVVVDEEVVNDRFFELV